MAPLVRVDVIDSVAWVWLDRPEKRNAMSPALNDEMITVLDTLEADENTSVLVLAGAGGNFSAGMDLKEFFAEIDHAPPSRQAQVRRAAYTWQYERLRGLPKPTIAMIDGWCLGGAFTPMLSCDIVIAAEDASFGLSEVNWGILPAGVVSRDIATAMRPKDAAFFALTGRPFTGKQAADMGLITLAVPKADLHDQVRAVAAELMKKNPATLRAIKEALRYCPSMSFEQARDYLYAKHDQLRFLDPDHGREQGLEQFMAKRFRPALQSYERDARP